MMLAIIPMAARPVDESMMVDADLENHRFVYIDISIAMAIPMMTSPWLCFRFSELPERSQNH